MIGDLPTSLEVNGVEYKIRTNMKDILKVVQAFDDVELEDSEKVYICLLIIYEDFESMPKEDYKEALDKAVWFIDCGAEPSKGHKKTMDWEQDEALIFPAVNRVAGCEVRSLAYIHWWTFMGYFMEIHDGTYAQVLQLRSKRANGKKLEKWEREYWENNKEICEIKQKYTEEEKEQMRKLNELLM